jgi:hypothetical protein
MDIKTARKIMEWMELPEYNWSDETIIDYADRKLGSGSV